MPEYDIKEIRDRLGESQEVFGQRIGVDQATIHRWEKYGVPKVGTARIAVKHLLDDLRRRRVRL